MENRSIKVLALWLFLIAASIGTYFLSHKIETGNYGVAAVLLAGASKHEVSLYSDRVEPSIIKAGVGDEIIFSVMDDSRHNISEERDQRREARLESGEIGRNESYSLIFHGKGTYYFYDRMNQEIRPTIVIK